MPSSDLDMPLLPSAEQIRRREFATVRRGYDPQQVRAYLTSIAEQVGMLERELAQFRLESETAAATSRPSAPMPAPAQDPYDALSKRFSSLIEMADQEAERILSDARTEAKMTVDEARGEADRIRVDAQARAEEARQEGTDLLDRAKEESDRLLSGLADRRSTLVQQLEEMRTKLLAVADELAEPIDAAARMDDEEEAELTTVSSIMQSAATANADDAAVDPKYEDLWVSNESIAIPDLASMDLDFDDTE